MYIPVGTKVQVVASSINNRGATPRIGSQGYCCINTANVHPYKHELGVFLLPSTIAFTRYGYQRKERCETRNVCLVIPAAPHVSGYHAKYLQGILKRLKDHNKIKYTMYRALRLRKIPKKMPPFLVVKTLPENLMSVSPVQFEAWYKTILKNQDINMYIDMSRRHKDKNSLIGNQMLSVMNQNYYGMTPGRWRHIRESRPAFIHHLGILNENPQPKRHIIEAIGLYNQLMTAREVRGLEERLFKNTGYLPDSVLRRAATILTSLHYPISAYKAAFLKQRLMKASVQVFEIAQNWAHTIENL